MEQNDDEANGPKGSHISRVIIAEYASGLCILDWKFRGFLQKSVSTSDNFPELSLASQEEKSINLKQPDVVLNDHNVTKMMKGLFQLGNDIQAGGKIALIS